MIVWQQVGTMYYWDQGNSFGWTSFLSELWRRRFAATNFLPTGGILVSSENSSPWCLFSPFGSSSRRHVDQPSHPRKGGCTCFFFSFLSWAPFIAVPRVKVHAKSPYLNPYFHVLVTFFEYTPLLRCVQLQPTSNFQVYLVCLSSFFYFVQLLSA